MKKKILNNKNTTAGTGSGFEQAQGPYLWAYMLTIKLMVSSKLTWGKKINNENTTAGTGSGCEQAQGHELWAHMLTFKLFESSILTWKINKLTTKIALPVPAVALSKPRAITCELTWSQSSWWSAQNSSEKIESYKENTTAGIGSGFEQAQGHQLWAYIFTNKLMVSSNVTWEKKN
jgi:hypothetical protein